MLTERRWPTTGLRVVDDGDAVIIEQSGRRYRASKWRLTDDVLAVIDSAMRNGLLATWIPGHPRDDYFEDGRKFNAGIHHITFARRHTDKRWVFVLGGTNGPPEITSVTFNWHYLRAVLTAGVDYQMETKHGLKQNVKIALDDLESVLRQISDPTIEEVESRPRNFSKKKFFDALKEEFPATMRVF